MSDRAAARLAFARIQEINRSLSESPPRFNMSFAVLSILATRAEGERLLFTVEWTPSWIPSVCLEGTEVLWDGYMALAKNYDGPCYFFASVKPNKR